MKLEMLCAWRNLLKLLKFLVLYAGGVALLLYLLPMGAALLQSGYESMSGIVKLSVVAGFGLAVSAVYLWSRFARRGGTLTQEPRASSTHSS